MCVLLLNPLLISSTGGVVQVLSSEWKINQADFTEWMSFLSSNSEPYSRSPQHIKLKPFIGKE